MLLQKEELEQKHLHLVQIVESEKTAKWQYTQQCEELTIEIKKLRAEASIQSHLQYMCVAQCRLQIVVTSCGVMMQCEGKALRGRKLCR